MAGYIISGMRSSVNPETHVDSLGSESKEFCIGQDLRLFGLSRVVTLQVDCDELDAVVWGIENYNKRR